MRPGEQAKLLGVIRNESSVVDNYDLSVSGLPESWWTISPATAYLVPFGAGDACEQEFELLLHPPRAPEAQARAWSLTVVATPRAQQTRAESLPAALNIGPYQELTAKIAPDRASGRLKGRFVLTLRNRSNAPAEVRLHAADAEDACQLRFAQPSVTLKPGQGVEAPMTVLPKKQIWLGRAKDHLVKVTASPDGSSEPPAIQTGTYRQRSWLPWWLALVAPVAAAVIAAAVLLLPKQVLVPNLKHASSVFAAEKIAIRAGLKLSPQVSQMVSTAAKPGSIVDQAPAAGAKVKRGSTVTVAVALGTDLTKVPSVVGSTPVSADGTLRAAHLVLGTVSPQPPNPNGSIASQIPAAGQMVAEGTAVTVFLRPPAAPTGKKGGATTPAAAVVLPALAATVTAAAQELSQRGLLPMIVRQFSSQPAGRLVGTNPPAGETVSPGGAVQLIVSAGYPELSYDDGSQIHVINGATEKASGTDPPGQNDDEASWSPDGKELVYVQGPASGGQLMSFTPNQPGAKPIALTGSSSNERDPAFSPNGQVLAFIDRSAGYGQLCFASAGAVAPLNTSDCTSFAGYDLGGQISWAPNGKSILVFGSQRRNRSNYGLIEFHTSVPFSPNSSVWDRGTMVTIPNQNVIAGAFSPDGKHVALISNSNFHLFIAPARVFDISKATLYATEACQVSWRSDSEALAVMQSSGGCAPNNNAYPTGNIVTFELASPDQQQIVASNAENPSWQPLSLSG